MTWDKHAGEHTEQVIYSMKSEKTLGRCSKLRSESENKKVEKGRGKEEERRDLQKPKSGKE